ncbi:hypothetical protein FQZ97_1040510 [compost metagenome]
MASAGNHSPSCTGTTVIAICAETLPALLLAVMVKTVLPWTAVGVPLIAPVFALMLSPGGKAGDILNKVASPPEYFGTS